MIKYKKDYIGYNAIDVLNYLKKSYTGKTTKRFFLLFGLPGTGKTTLINVIENEESITMRRSNASDTRKTGDINIGDYISSGIIDKQTCLILDECDSLPAATWKKIESMAKLSQIPIILIANDINKIPDRIKKNSQKKELKVNRFSLLAFAKRENEKNNLKLTESQISYYVDRCKSYRCLKTLLEFGYTDEQEITPTQNKMILTAMHGKFTKFKTADLRSLIIIYHDNVKSARDIELISQADIYLNRYEHGYKNGKYIVNIILNSIRNKKIKLDYPRTFKLIHESRTGKRDTNVKTKRKMPNISITGLK